MIVKTWTDPVYDTSILLIVGPRKRACNEIARIFGEDVRPDAESFARATTFWVSKPQGAALVLWFSEAFSKTSPTWLGILAHEALHGASYVLGERGVKFSEDSEEAFAYYVKYLCENVLTRVKR